MLRDSSCLMPLPYLLVYNTTVMTLLTNFRAVRINSFFIIIMYSRKLPVTHSSKGQAVHGVWLEQ